MFCVFGSFRLLPAHEEKLVDGRPPPTMTVGTTEDAIYSE